ncbi:MAG: hypothetical protein COA78_26135 [Blastopirellula sp.]|nr:MAG: hypothetical protein COA78_26135 [Blastopirellula sp.]
MLNNQVGTNSQSETSRLLGQSVAVFLEYGLVLALIFGSAFLGADILSQVAQYTSSDVILNNNVEFQSIESINSETLSAMRNSCIAFAVLLLVGFGIWTQLNQKRTRSISLQNIVELEKQHYTKQKSSELFNKRQLIYDHLSSDTGAISEGRIEVKHLMSERVIKVSTRKKVTDIQTIMRDKHVRHVLVVDEVGKLAGVISNRVFRNVENLVAKNVMSYPVLSVETTSLLSPAITQMINRKVSCLAVVDEGEIKGILTSTDIMMALQSTMRLLQTGKASPNTNQENTDDSTLESSSC